ncbi:DUF2997 domain-containing protein [Sphaerospermopsis sp. FACHB-1094]|uniref:DUF2997 domain-containing protein n=1 Tax=Sphaerospermopsis reniformis TaxID=531300 RepID=A0A480AA31_9CYAN|nr:MULTISPECIES: DUF2997 domain-containing protein [Sphaerospermopsis]MBD2131044.1 DUF2997 domain-containing protein [Sphaerospermopsis sp. FACHB-1094]GCL39014.1 hypothetical protein SR1949_41350 [Sphaerospermopsis reniformis]
MERAILIHFDAGAGEVKIEAEGFEGLSCIEATQPFEEALGIVGDRTYKPESQQQVRTTNTHQHRLHQ